MLTAPIVYEILVDIVASGRHWPKSALVVIAPRGRLCAVRLFDRRGGLLYATEHDAVETLAAVVHFYRQGCFRPIGAFSVRALAALSRQAA